MEITVRPGDSLWYYSQLFGIPLVLIENSNPNKPENQLQIGQKINIPGYVVREHTVKEDDSLRIIAMTNNIPLDSLELLNPLIKPTQLQIGQRLLMPERVNNIILTDFVNYTYEKMCGDLQRLQLVYPFIFEQNIGHSVMEKDIFELQIGAGTKEVLLNGSFHANEWITTPIIMKFLNQFALSLTNHIPIRGIFMLPLYNDTRLSIVPMVNPDGVNLVINGSTTDRNYEQRVLAINNQNEDFSNWKANINGVDLNNQFAAKWGIEAERKPTNPKPRDYPGPYPLSEPEAITMAELARERNFIRLNAFHTQGEEIYWGFDGFEPPVSEGIANEYARVSGYKPVRYLDNYAGYKDWFIQEFHLPGFTIELGSGVNPLPIEQFPKIYQNCLGIMLANLYL